MQVSDKLEWLLSSLGFITPEIIIASGIVILVITGVAVPGKIWPRVVSLTISAGSILFLFLSQDSSTSMHLFGGMLIVDGFNFYLRFLISASAILIIIISQQVAIIKYSAEYFIMILSIALGAQLLVMSQHFVMMIISLELMSIPAYVLAGFNFSKLSAEATMKYFIYGSIATAFLIFGVSWIYGLSGTLNFSSPGFVQKLKFNDHELFLGAGLLIMGGLLFKMASTPFHFWAPDVYQATPMPVLALFSTIPKIAAASVLIKLTHSFLLRGGTHYDWQTIIAVIAMATLTAGNFSALLQRNVKRLMAYSSIGQGGFLLIASCTLSESGNQVFLFYGTTLVVSTVLAFLTLHYFENLSNTENVKDFSGMGRQLPEMSALLTVAMISLVGLPITAGFTGKLFIFTSLLEAWSTSGKDILIWLFIFGLLNTVISLYYYLRIPYYLFLKRGPLKQISSERPILPILFGVFMAFILFWIFFQPDSLMGWINRIKFEAL